jgi:uncharacterized protein YbjQ (UPF0145 family)
VITTTTLADIPGYAISEVLGVVGGDGERVVDALVAIEDLAENMEADAVIDVRASVAGAFTPHGARFRATAIGTAVRLSSLSAADREAGVDKDARVETRDDSLQS